jgi:hypothetical protein
MFLNLKGCKGDRLTNIKKRKESKEKLSKVFRTSIYVRPASRKFLVFIMEDIFKVHLEKHTGFFQNRNGKQRKRVL